METLVCCVCNQQLPNLVELKKHYLRRHKKITIIQQIVKCSNLHATPRRNSKRNQKTHESDVNGNIQISCNGVTFEDDENIVDMEFSFEENSSESKENYYVPATPKKKPSKERNNNKSSGDLKVLVEQIPHYRINITKVNNLEECSKSLDESTGSFYECNCRSVTPPASPEIPHPQFCNECGKGYKTERELVLHKQSHETYCVVCRVDFDSHEMLKTHVRHHLLRVYVCHVCREEFMLKQLLEQHYTGHTEEELFETVLDLETDYAVQRFPVEHMNYLNSINSILHFLNDKHDMHGYCMKYSKTQCDICRYEVFLCDYEYHLQVYHNSVRYYDHQD